MKHIVMIDDDPDDQVFYARLFKEIDSAIKFESFLSVDDFFNHQTTDEKPYLILLDLNIPKVSGMDFIRNHCDKGSINSNPIVVLTTSSSPLDMADCKKCGVHSYFIKPFNCEDCKELVMSIYQYWFIHNQLLNHF